MTIRDALKTASSALMDAHILPFEFEARQLVAFAADIQPSLIPVKMTECLNDEQEKTLYECVSRRKNGEPLQYIIGQWEFYSLPFFVGDGVLIPRADTEVLVDCALKFTDGRSLRVADLCSGSGCVAISIKKNAPGCAVTAFELSEAALGYLNKNAELNNIAVNIVPWDIKNTVPEKFDLIVSNPPYIERDVVPTLSKEVSYEPTMALDGGEDGLDFYRLITEKWVKCLDSGGALAVEIGIGQSQDVKKLFSRAGLENITAFKDINGIDRVIFGTLPPLTP